LIVITKTTVKTIIAGGGVLATWFAVGPTHSTHQSVPAPTVRSAAIQEGTADELNAQARKLRDQVGAARLRPSTRNPFRFGSPRLSTTSKSHAEPAPAAIVPEPAIVRPQFSLSGVAARNTPQGPKRTAVITGSGQLYVVTEGEMVGGQFTVVRIDPEAVLLRDAAGAEITLTLR
jgi:hypothetical protein